MSEIVLTVASPVIAVLSGAIATYVIFKRTVNDAMIMDKLDMILTEVSTNTEVQKKIYLIGAILGNGIKSGIGFAGKGGKFKLDDIIATAAGQLFGNLFGGKSDSNPLNPQQQPQKEGDPFNVG